MYVDDPVLRDRIVITKKIHFVNIWKNLFIVVIMLGGAFFAGAYFFSKPIDVMVNQLNLAPSATKSDSLIPTNIQPVEKPVTPVENTESIISEADNIISMDTVKSSNVPTEESIENTIPPQPAETKIAVVTPIPEMVINQPKSEENELFNKAKEQFLKRRLTTPEGDNAYETYQLLLIKNPQQAQIILNDIVQWYFENGLKYIRKGKIIYPKNENNAISMYQKLIEIVPEHQSAQMLLNKIISNLAKYTQKQIRKNKINHAISMLQKMQKIAPEHFQTQDLQNKIVNKLFSRAQSQMGQEKFTTPKKDNAADSYRKILTIVANNEQAQEGLQKIANAYYQLAKKTKRKRQYVSSMTWIKKGLKVMPDDSKLNQLKQEVESKL
ncbi:MAG: hypothetical protein KAH84_12885 [Thiomargarita sp.]|nr:hypothetical protein [Thiomargarita sp.]